MKRQKRTIWKHIKIFAAVICLIAGLSAPSIQAQAEENPVSLSSCKLNGSGSKLTVKAKVKTKTKAMGKKLYLVSLDAYSSSSGTKSVKSLASVKAKKGKISFTVKYKNDMLFQKFAVAYKTNGKYKIVSDVSYITNPENLASYKGKGPKTTSKKGLQVEELSDSLEIGTQHAIINWTLSSILSTSGTPYKYKGKTYYFDEGVLQYNDSLVQAYNAAGVKVTAILLLPMDGEPETSSMRFDGPSAAKFSSVKTSTKAGSRTFEAVMTFLAKRYGTKKNLVSGWIVGNEVNSPFYWNYGGSKSQGSYMYNYARTFRICYNAVKSVSKYAKVYISLDNNWNQDFDGKGTRYFTTKSTMDRFYKEINKEGKVPFQIAYHAYPQGLSDPIFWDDKSASTNANKAKIVNFKNLNVLTDYVKKTYGKNYTIMLSEQSFNSSRGEAVQAAAYAYAYYLSETNSMIESFIYGREFDNLGELDERRNVYRWGLCDNWHNKRLIWSVFQYIDTKDSFKFTDPLVKYTNLKKWSKIKGFKTSKYKGMKSKRETPAVITDLETLSSTSVLISWEKQNAGDGYEILRKASGEEDYRVIGEVSGNSTVSFTDTSVTAGQRYTYKVKMYKEAPAKENANARVRLYGKRSAGKSITVSVGKVTLDTSKCNVNGKEITVVYKKVSGASGYEILRSTTETGTYVPTGTTTATKYKDENTQTGTTYYYKVRAYVTVNGQTLYGKESDVYSDTARIQLSYEIKDGKLTLNWTQWPNVGTYRVYATTDPDEKGYMVRGGKDMSGFSWTSKGKDYQEAPKEYIDFEVGEKYYIKVRASLGNDKYSDYSNVISFVLKEDLDSTGINEPAVISDTEETETENPTESEETETEVKEPTETENPTESEETETEIKESTETENSTENTETETEVKEPTETENSTESTETETEIKEPTETENSTENTETETEVKEPTETENSMENTETETEVKEPTETENPTESTETETEIKEPTETENPTDKPKNLTENTELKTEI